MSLQKVTFLICALAWGLSAGAAITELPTPVTRVLAAHSIPQQSISLFVQGVEDSEPFLLHNADIPRNPASTIKLLTTFVALDVLGPAHTWPTEAYIDGIVEKGRLRGDLILKGYGDPFLVTERFWLFLRELRRKGLQHVDGDLLIDNSHFAPEPIDPAAFDNQPYRIYNVQPDALLINFKSVRFTFMPGGSNGKVLVSSDPELSNLSVRNTLRVIDKGCYGYQRGIRIDVFNEVLGGRVDFSGKFPSRCSEYSMSRTVLEPATYAYGLFDTLWREMGGTLDGKIGKRAVPADAEPFHRMESRPLGELIRSVNKFSSNVMTRQLLLSLGVEAFGPPGTHSTGKAAIENWLALNGLEFPELVLDNGAGLSRETRISAKSMGQLLLRAYESPFMPEFISSLPLAAMDGTLSDRFVGEPLAGYLHVKTGRLDHVYAMAGYVLSRSGKKFVVVAMANHQGVHRGTGAEALDALLRWTFDQ